MTRCGRSDERGAVAAAYLNRQDSRGVRQTLALAPRDAEACVGDFIDKSARQRTIPTSDAIGRALIMVATLMRSSIDSRAACCGLNAACWRRSGRPGAGSAEAEDISAFRADGPGGVDTFPVHLRLTRPHAQPLAHRKARSGAGVGDLAPRRLRVPQHATLPLGCSELLYVYCLRYARESFRLWLARTRNPRVTFTGGTTPVDRSA